MSDAPIFQPTIAQSLYGAEHGTFDMPRFAESMFTGILREWERVFWNIHQKSFDNHRHEATAIGAVFYRPYVWDTCDCGGEYPNHASDCQHVTGHDAWNDARLKWATIPKDADQIEEEQAGVDKAAATGSDMAFMLAAMTAASSRLDMARLCSDEYPVPHPPCTCGAADDWEGHACHEFCISRQPNFGISGDPVQIRWYKYPGRGMSVNVALDPIGWQAWHDRVFDALGRAECDATRLRMDGHCHHYSSCPYLPPETKQS
jgi:hypothetical protein